jgi:hypothetical protein
MQVNNAEINIPKTPQPPEEGIYSDLSNDDYHASPGISNSGIGLILKSPKKYWYKYLSGQYDKTLDDENKSFIAGKALHSLTLENKTFGDFYYTLPKLDRRRTEDKLRYEECLKEANGKIILSKEDYDKTKAMMFNIMNHPLFTNYMRKSGNIEHSIFWKDPELDVLLRSRPDYFNEDGIVIDIKTSKDASEEAFSRAINNYGYHRQGALACDGLTFKTGISFSTVILFVIETIPPYLVATYVINSESLEYGRRSYKKGAEIYKRCLEKNEWPGYSEQIIELSIPYWTIKDYEI